MFYRSSNLINSSNYLLIDNFSEKVKVPKRSFLNPKTKFIFSFTRKTAAVHPYLHCLVFRAQIPHIFYIFIRFNILYH